MITLYALTRALVNFYIIYFTYFYINFLLFLRIAYIIIYKMKK